MSTTGRRFGGAAATARGLFRYGGAMLGLLGAARAWAADSAGIAFFEQKIRPVLAEQCYECHSAQAKKLKAGLLLDTKAGWERGGDSGTPVVVPGRPEESLLLRAMQHAEPDLAMPPKQPRLPEATLADFVTWIRMGAPDPRDGGGAVARRADKSWWSLQPLRPAEPPAGPSSDPIDRYIDAALAPQGLTRNPPASARELVRRMTYDVTGLPPTPAEVAAFARDYALDPARATEALVDRLLASPQYGEQWGRHWLDVVRFGESIGFERNVIIDDLWPFRDYVIASLNADKPFNRFIVEHLAGDVVGKNDPAVEVGTAFLVAGPYDDVSNQDVAAKKNIRAATLDDLITATGGAFLGLTLNCARCHHHKFDPIPTEDYYRLRAAFEGVTHGRRVLATPEERVRFAAATAPLKKAKAALETEKAALDTVIDARAKAELAARLATRHKVDPLLTEERFEPVRTRRLRFVMHASTANPRSAGASRLTEFEVWSAGADSRNVALARHGTQAAGEKSTTAEDFAAAYGPQLVIDGDFGEQWFIGSPAVLTLTFSREETVDRITFRNAKGGDINDEKSRGATPCEYEVQVSADGREWRTVASSEGREPWTLAHGVERLRRTILTPEERRQLTDLASRLGAVERDLKAVPPLREVFAGKFAQPAEPTFVHKGGDPLKPGEPVVPASPAVLAHAVVGYALPADAPEGERRLALARWITRDDNPLPLRVLANRVWQYHFGTGLVDTPSDFGFLGGVPSHPALLDYLADRLRAHGWRLKPLHREILLSATYRQSGLFRPEAARVDHEARLLWRFPPRRLSAEELRDTMLAVSGQLDRRMGGPGFRLYKFTQNNVCTYFPLDEPGPATYRRAVYHQNARASVVDVLSDFDFPDIAFSAPRRVNTTTPLQALTLLNHRFTLDLARALAGRWHGDAAAQVRQAYTDVFQREPTAAELAAAMPLFATYGPVALGRALLNANELLYVE